VKGWYRRAVTARSSERMVQTCSNS